MGPVKFPSPKDMWEKHEKIVLEVFSLALEMLRNEEDLPPIEDRISEILSLKTREANYWLNQNNRGLQYPPNWEKPIPPMTDSDLGYPQKKKRPDFSCTFRNNSAQNASEAYVEYHIECKCLGEPTSPTWKLNVNYVVKGIYRFLDPTHGYGKGANSSTMIGYILSMDIQTILQDINQFIQGESIYQIPRIRFQNTSNDTSIAKAKHPFIREYINPPSFHLWHLWVNLIK